jgi:antitoxin (DNA-binding transcriptional repressor) of toxin-antitoxin stability system
MRSIKASEFKAKCLAILEELSRTGEAMTILKRDRPIALLLPLLMSESKHPQLTLKGTFEITGDIIAPTVAAEDWGAESGAAP